MSRQLTKQLLLSSNYWVLNKTVVKLFGVETAFLLSNFAEAETVMSDKDGWFYQTSDTVEEMTTLSRHKQDQCIKELEEKGILKKDLRGVPAKRYFKINYECLTNLIVNFQQTSMSKTDKLDCEKSTTNKESSYKESNKESNKERIGKKSKIDLQKYDLSQSVVDVLAEFVEHRKQMKKPTTQLAITKIVNMFQQNKYNDDEMILSLEKSIMNGYQGVFPLKDNERIYKEVEKPKEVLPQFESEEQRQAQMEHVARLLRSQPPAIDLERMLE